MNDTLIGEIQTFTLQARGDLEREVHEQLEGFYGWLPDGSFAPVIRYPALALNEARETRARLEQYLRDEAEAGFDAAKARRKLVREAAFTWLNRFVAFKMLKTRRVLKTLLAPPERSNAYLLWLADERDPEARGLHDAGDTPVNALGEGPRQTAYRRFLLWQCDELAREMSVLFDPATLASRLCPRPNALRALVDSLNATNLAEAWTAGNEETIGWVYQAFSSEELKAAFAAARESKKKFEAEDIPAVTQLFTIRWVVRYLVENSLGRLWIEMHPDSTMKDKLAYLVPPASQPAARPVKPVREILFLDPACGSMHFGLVAFDLFAEMYREEITRAGQPGWPVTPSVATEVDIPAAIVANNLHGIDLDPRAVQISALTLLIKARGLNPKAVVTDHNLACCNVEAITGGRLDAIIQGAKLDQPIQERILRAMAARLKDSNNLGSLLRPEDDLDRLIQEERASLEAKQKKEPLFVPPDLQTPEAREKFFAGLAKEIAKRLDAFVQGSRAVGKDESHFVGETAKGLNFLRLVQQRYDVVATNPPYMSGGKMNQRLATLMAEEYPDGKSDLYAAFIQRCSELLDPQGLMGMLTMHSYMFISSYEALRDQLRGQVAIQTMAHFGGGLFSVGNPGTLQTTAFVFERQPDTKQRDSALGVYYRLVKGRDSEAKRLAFESGLAALCAGQPHPQVFTYKQSDFDAIPGKPWVYWTDDTERRLFRACPKLSDLHPIDSGLKTSGNKRFCRLHWEVARGTVAQGNSAAEFRSSPQKWFRYAKGGVGERELSSVYFVVNWQNHGRELKQFLVNKYPYLKGNTAWCTHNEGLYCEEGITWSSISPKGFIPRFLEAGSICSNAGFAIFPGSKDALALFGILRSDAVRYIMRILCPTINQTKGGVDLLPVPDFSDKKETMEYCARSILSVAAQLRAADETAPQFIAPKRAGSTEDAACVTDDMNGIAMNLFGLSDKQSLIAELLEAELTGDDAGENTDANRGEDDEDEDVQALVVSQAEISKHWISYAIGTVLGRFEIGKPGGLGCGDFPEPVVAAIRKLVDANGIMPCEAGHPQDLAALTLACLTLMLGADFARETILSGLGEGDLLDALRGWFDRFTGQPAQSFWRHHFQQYRKRPVYWPFQSPNRSYTVWVFHERLGPDTLFGIRNKFVEPRLRLAEREIADLLVRAGKDRKAAKELDRMLDLADDLNKFAANLKAIAEHGYTPHIDDGVLLNAARLHEVLPSWPDTRTAWKELEEGKYDWAHQAMAYWPGRVKASCLTNKSFAIAHGLAVAELAPATDTPKRKGRKKRE